ncbi:hypothetical protein FACS1894217_07030 [Clostridia bacterium]|nr:hypothetical protein FACS1894202_11750 [Clostridia bacterium]GHV07062.1 hypothetical protein FACS1894217_07030 [Clostridia bacterium]
MQPKGKSKLRFEEDDNAGIEAARGSKQTIEGANNVRKAVQKRSIKRQYAKATRQGTIHTVQKAAKRATETAQKTGQFIARHWRGIGIALAIVVLVALLFAGLSSCGSMLMGGFNSIIGSSYTAEDENITGVDDSYTALESGLSRRIARIETDYPNYDEYRYSLDEIRHAPFELASYLTAKFANYTSDEVQAELSALFGRQYTLTLTPVTEVRYRTETQTDIITDPDTGEETEVEYEVEVAYNYYTLNIVLVNRSLGRIVTAGLTAEQKEMYDLYMETRGNKPYLFEVS